MCWISPCPFCKGNRAKCAHCSGENRIPVHRCPNALVGSRHFDAISAANLVEFGVLPNEGAWQDQPATWVQGFPLIWGEISHWRRVAQEAAAKGR